MSVLGGADALWGEVHAPGSMAVAHSMRDYIAAHVAAGGRAHSVTRHMLGLFTGQPGARAWRRTLSEGAGDGGLGAFDRALASVQAAQEAARAA
jgi:tRNA-dihydrouridine synthase A